MTPDTYRTRIYTHYVQAREQALAPETLAGLAPRAHALRYGDLTHETAFTRTSLSQLLSSGFGAVRCFKDAPVVHGAKSALRWLLWVSAVCCGFTLPPKRAKRATRTSFRRICWPWRADESRAQLLESLSEKEPPMLELIRASLKEHLDCIQHMEALTDILRQSGEQLIRTIQSGGCAFICGNGGSAGDAQHFAAELTGRFGRAWPATELGY